MLRIRLVLLQVLTTFGLKIGLKLGLKEGLELVLEEGLELVLVEGLELVLDLVVTTAHITEARRQ